MFGSQNFETISMHIDVDPGGDKTYHLWRAPSECTVKNFSAVTSIAHGAGTAYSLALHNWGAVGTALKSSDGTVMAAIGGTADPFAASTPEVNTTMSNPFVDSGEWLMLVLDEQGAGWQNGEILQVQVDVVYGQAARND